MATTKRGIRYPYGEDYDLDADVPEDLKKMAESTDEAIDDVEESLEEKLGTYENTYDSTETYLIGSIVVYDKKIYECLEETTGEFDTTKWQEISIKELIDLYKQQTDNNTEAIQELDETKADIEDVEELQNEIKNNYKKITKLQEENEDLKKNQLTNTPTPATSHYLQDSADSRFRKFIPIGRTTQESTTGANVMKFTPKTNTSTGATYICDEKGQVTIKGTANLYDGNLSYNSEGVSLEVGTYKIKVIGNATGITFRYSGVYSYTETIRLDANQEATITIAEATSNFAILSGITKDITYNCDYYITLAKGTTATTERYTGGEPAPNPRYPYAIKNTGDNVNLLSNLITRTNTTINNGIVTQVTADTKTNLEWKVMKYNNNSKVEELPLIIKNNIGIFSIGFIKDSSFNKIVFGLNGAQISTLVESDVNNLPNGEYTLSYSITNVTQGSISWKDVKLEQGTKATPYSPYGCGNVNEKVQNKNLFDINTAEKNVWLGQNNNRLVIQNAIVTDYIRVNSNKSYTFSSINNYTSSRAYYTVNQFDKNHTWIKGQEFSLSVGNNLNATVNLESNCSFIKFSVRDITLNTNVQVEEGSTATSYVPHSEQNISFPLAQGQKLMEDGTIDGKVKNEWREVVYDGSVDEGWKLNGSSTSPTNRTVIRKDNQINMANENDEYISNMFIRNSETSNRLIFYSSGIYLSLEDSITGIQTNDSNEVKLTKMLTYLSNNPVQAQIKLATPIEEDFTEEQKTAWEEWKKARTYKNVTHISSEDETPANVEIEYVQDTKTYIDNKVTALTNAIISLGGNI